MTHTKLPISVLILAKTAELRTQVEQQQLDRACASARFAAELKVIEHAHPIKDFAHARNMALKQAQHDWVFFLDSDEWFADSAPQAIQELLSEKHLAGITIRRIDVFHNKPLKHGETGSHYLLRFMRRDKSCFIRPVHENAQIDGLVIRHNLTIWHETHHDISEFWQTICNYAELDAEWRITNNPNTSLLRTSVELFTYPIGKFVVNFIIKIGWRDGWHGLVYAYLMSLHSAFVRIFMLEKITAATKK